MRRPARAGRTAELEAAIMDLYDLGHSPALIAAELHESVAKVWMVVGYMRETTAERTAGRRLTTANAAHLAAIAATGMTFR